MKAAEGKDEMDDEDGCCIKFVAGLEINSLAGDASLEDDDSAEELV